MLLYTIAYAYSAWSIFHEGVGEWTLLAHAMLRRIEGKARAGQAPPNRRQVKERKNGSDGRAACRSQGGGKLRPYNRRAWEAESPVYCRGDPCGRPAGWLRVSFANKVE
jgi:hypothetical protein